jgi:DNA-binding transcriptional LysR family regulator
MAFRPRQLHYFITVANDGQLTRAAKKLGVAQPALSQAISLLEAEIGLRLFDRSARGVTLTAAGEVFLPKAIAAVESEQEVERVARTLSSKAAAQLTVGFIGPPPLISAPELFDAFTERYPNVELAWADLPFPRGSTRSWIDGVDVAFCHPPREEAGIASQVVRQEPRSVVMRDSHPLATQAELTVDQVLGETFIRYHPDVQASWAAFHSLDNHRGGPPAALTKASTATSLQMLSAMSTTRAITTVPACDAEVARKVASGLVAVPLRDAEPSVLSLTWLRRGQSQAVEGLARVADEMLTAVLDAGLEANVNDSATGG